MTSDISDESEAFEIESARDAVFTCFIVQRSLMPLDLSTCEYMLLRRSVFTEEGYKKMFQPSRRILYALHLDLPRDMERSLRTATPYKADRYMTFYVGVPNISERVYNRDLALVIVNNIRRADNKTEKLRRYLNLMKCLKLDRYRRTVNFIFDNVIHFLYPECMDSNLVVEFAEIFNFYSWTFYRESPDIVGYVLEHARRMRYNIWGSNEWKLDPINACITFHTTGNIGKLLEYGTVLRTNCHLYMEILGEFLGRRQTTTCRISERRIFLLIQLFYIFVESRASWTALRLIWRSIPDPYLSGKELYFAFGGIITPEYFYALNGFYNSTVVEENPPSDHTTPRLLLQLCRVAIRSILSSNFQLPHGIGQLGVGKTLESYLKLQY
ncbi:hypothetical protein HNY73_019967 [Argiope bruennichi]|uniref:SOCS box domain-containing protein n=1 Tax=Argiope bruennichi TaxID=94029 RepID=A0A8T0E7U1_ARGBR|nr:hypothetical protein HNY73_019967 [Argiope bruennichi]